MPVLHPAFVRSCHASDSMLLWAGIKFPFIMCGAAAILIGLLDSVPPLEVVQNQVVASRQRLFHATRRMGLSQNVHFLPPAHPPPQTASLAELSRHGAPDFCLHGGWMQHLLAGAPPCTNMDFSGGGAILPRS